MRPNISSLSRIPVLACSALVLSGCLSDGESASVDEPSSVTFDVSGSVGDGPVVGADMQVLGADDALLAQFLSDGSAGYRISLNADTAQVPLRVTANGGTDLVTNAVPDFTLQSALFASNRDATVNVNPFTTIAVETAKDLGGLTQTNYASAMDIIVQELNGGLTSLANGGVTTQPIGSSNIAEIVRASETVGELIRRVRNEMNGASLAMDGDQVLGAIAADLTDGVIDGRGGSRANTRVAALSNLLLAQILAETLRGELRVNDANAMTAIESAIAEVSASPASPSLGELTATGEMIRSTRVGLVAAHAVSGDDELAGLLDAAAGLQEGMDAGLVRALLPGRAATILDTSVAAVASGNESLLELVNRAARERQTSIPAGNQPPSIAGTPPGSVVVGNNYSFTPDAIDPDADTLSFAVTGLPGWASFDSVTGALTGTPSAGDVGSYDNIRISVSDGQAEAALPPFSITVVMSNTAPTISGNPPASVTVGVAYDFTPTASDADGDALTFSIENRPQWAAFNTSTGRLSGTPAAGDVGSYDNIQIRVSDGMADAALAPFSITVTAAANGAPTISGTPATSVVVGAAYQFTPTASDPNGDTLTFSVQNRPQWASFNTSTGRLSGTPAAGDVGSYDNIQISVSDGQSTAGLAAFSIAVTAAPNGTPTISGTPATSVVAGAAYQFTPTASDPDGDTLTFDIENRPQWAAFDTSTGGLSGTPAAGDVGSYANIRISVSDGQSTASLAAFSITVTAVPNGAPTIGGTPPASVLAGSAYTFTPSASDPDNDTLSFAAVNLPGWASFDTATGRISGTPQAGDVGVYGNIRITVSDGAASAELGPFSIEVMAVALGSVTLTWTPPTQNTDGSPLTDLVGYRIYWGNGGGVYPQSVTINNPGVSSYVVENLPPGDYEFVATALNSAGVESGFSNTATRTVP